MDDKPLRKAIVFFGSQKRVAEVLGVSKKTVNGWLNQCKQMPLHHAMQLEELTLGAIKAEEFVPHLKKYVVKYKTFLKGK